MKQEYFKGNFGYNICPNCIHWQKETLKCNIDFLNKRKISGNTIGCGQYDDSHTRPNNWEMGMG